MVFEEKSVYRFPEEYSDFVVGRRGALWNRDLQPGGAGDRSHWKT